MSSLAPAATYAAVSIATRLSAMAAPFRPAIVPGLVALLLTACQSAPVTGRSQLLIVPEETAIASSQTAYMQMLTPLQKQGKLDNDPAVTKRIVAITERLVPHAIKHLWSRTATPQQRISTLSEFLDR